MLEVARKNLGHLLQMAEEYDPNSTQVDLRQLLLAPAKNARESMELIHQFICEQKFLKTNDDLSRLKRAVESGCKALQLIDKNDFSHLLPTFTNHTNEAIPIMRHRIRGMRKSLYNYL